MKLEYYTSMNSKGNIDIIFDLSIKGFKDPNNKDKNPRLCMALRPYDKFD